ncbi:MAG: hypothetical protein VW877_11045 [Pseudomonadaceae bacterium]
MTNLFLRGLGVVTLSVAVTGLAGCKSGGGGGGDGASPEAPSSGPVVTLDYGLKAFEFSWDAVTEATYYQLYENIGGNEGYLLVADDITDLGYTLQNVALYSRVNSSYLVAACNAGGCTDSSPVFVSAHLREAIGYFKASNSDAGDNFGRSVALSADGNTLVIGAFDEYGDASSTAANPNNNASNAGAVYVFDKDGDGAWQQAAYLKASNAEAGDEFGLSVAVSDDGAVIAVGAALEDGDANSTVASPNNGAPSSGAAYVFTKQNGSWAQSAYIKAANAEANDYFGQSVALSADGSRLAVGAYLERGDASSTSTNPNNNAYNAGAAYVFSFSGGAWVQDAYLKASNAAIDDYFGHELDLSADGDTLVVGAHAEDGDRTSTADAPNDNASYAGAVYVFTNDGGVWSQSAYLKAENAAVAQYFGYDVALSADGATLVAGAIGESGDASSVMGSTNTNASSAGAIYVFTLDGGVWEQTGYLKASNAGSGDELGYSVAVSSDGTAVITGAVYEDGSSAGIDGADNDSSPYAGAAYIFRLVNGEWTQQSYLKASNALSYNYFGTAVALADDGTAAVSAYPEGNGASGISHGVTTNNNALGASGAVWLY